MVSTVHTCPVLLSVLLLVCLVPGPTDGAWRDFTKQAKKTFDRAVEISKTSYQKVKTTTTHLIDKAKDATLGERCNARWVKYNVKGLKRALEDSLCGQHVAAAQVLHGLASFKRTFGDKKTHQGQPLAFHFYGGHGTGKTYLARLVMDHLYRKGEWSKYVHVFTAEKDFPDRKIDVIYTHEIRSLLQKLAADCPHRLFVFDDFDKMGKVVEDGVLPLLRNTHVFSRSIFVFVSSSGQDKMESVLAKTAKLHSSRISITASDLLAVDHGDGALPAASCSADRVCDASVGGGLFPESFTRVPFLPMERQHVKCCLAVMAQQLDCSVGRKTLSTDEVEFVEGNGLEIAAGGCKKLTKVLARLCV